MIFPFFIFTFHDILQDENKLLSQQVISVQKWVSINWLNFQSTLSPFARTLLAKKFYELRNSIKKTASLIF